jgi:protein-S-isoprenylcysteine O-methyltransferase Ste14
MGSFAQGIAVGLFLGSPLATAYALAGTIGWNYFVRPWEELDLERRFGAPYKAYEEHVRCWIPNLQPYESEGPGRS